MKALFVTGTDTDAGKTFVSLGLVSAWRDDGLRVGVMKPCETGCADEEGTLIPADATALLRASRTALSVDEVCPYRYRLPMAPAEAWAAESAVDTDGAEPAATSRNSAAAQNGTSQGGGEFSIEKTAALFKRIGDAHDVTLVEGVGGLLVPFVGARTTIDLALALKTPLLIVARIGLGTINHTWLTVESACARGGEILGVVFTRSLDPQIVRPGPDEARNPEAVARLAGVKVLGNVPFIEGGDFHRVREFVDRSAILSAL